MGNDKSYKLPLILAVIMHVLLFAVLFLHFASSDLHQTLAQPDVDVIQAVAVSPPLSRPPVKPTQPVKTQQQQAEDIEQLQQQQIQKQQAEQQRQQQIAEQKALAAKQEQQKQADLAAQQALLKQQQAEATAKAQKAAEQKAQQELKKQQAAALAAKQKAEKKHQQAQAAQLKAAQDKALQEQIAQEQKALTVARTNEQQSEIDKYKGLIEQAISQNWIVPTGSDKDLTCELLIQVGPGGTVLNVEISRSSGDPGLDNSARAAVFKASPLPVPQDSALFEKFRELRLNVKPEDIMSQ